MTAPHYVDGAVTLYHGNCLDVLRSDDYGYDWSLGYRESRLLPDNSVDAVVTDPPYDLTAGKKGGTGAASVNLESPYGRSRIGTGNGAGGFMGQSWDATGVAFDPETWRQVARVLKPGGHLLAFGGSRTWHRLATAIEDAGFELRDSIAWLTGSGFPKSLDVSKDQRFCQCHRAQSTNGPAPRVDSMEQVGTADLSGLFDGVPSLTDETSRRSRADMLATVPGNPGSRPGAVSDQRGPQARRSWSVCGRCGKQSVVGLGTALKPAFEPIVVARKPLSGTVAATVLEHGTGALNIDACRVGDGSDSQGPRPDTEASATRRYGDRGSVSLTATPGPRGGSPDGRWPTNVLLDEDQAAELDQQSGVLKSGLMRAGTKRAERDGAIYGRLEGDATTRDTYADSGGASRFFPVFRYEAKAPSSERPSADGVAHPTVKPLALMRWLVRLVTPPNGLVLEPFAGSGTTAEACVHEHMRCIAIEREADYLPLIVNRLTKPMAIGFDFGAGA